MLSAELARLSRADGDVLTGLRTMQARALKDLSYGAYPDIGKARFFEMAWFRVRPGHEAQFEAAGKAYGMSAKRAGANAAYRVYEIVAGIPGPTYLIISSVGAYAEFDQAMADGDKTMKGLTADEGTLLQKFMLEGVVNVETQRFKYDPGQSYVPKETRPGSRVLDTEETSRSQAGDAAVEWHISREWRAHAGARHSRHSPPEPFDQRRHVLGQRRLERHLAIVGRDAGTPAGTRAAPGAGTRSFGGVRPVDIAHLTHQRVSAQPRLNPDLVALAGDEAHFDQRRAGERLERRGSG